MNLISTDNFKYQKLSTFFGKINLTRKAISFKIVKLDLCDQAVFHAA